MEKKRTYGFANKFGIDSYPKHCKILFDIYNINYCAVESTLTKIQVQKMLRPTFFGKLSSFQTYQFKVIFNFNCQ